MPRDCWNIISGLVEPRCPTCPGDCHVVPGDGPLHQVQCDYMFIGESPGKDDKDKPFSGRVAKEFNEILLPLSGLFRPQIYFTNARKCTSLSGRKFKPHEIKSCSGHFLPYELELVQPSIVVLMGGTANSLIEDDDNPIDLEVHHGRARQADLFGNTYTVFSTYHPALGLHDTTKIRLLRQDFIDLKRYMETGWNGAVDRLRGQERYFLLGNDKGAVDYLNHCRSLLGVSSKTGSLPVIATDTETVNGVMWSWQVSVEPGASIMGMCDDRESMKVYMELLDKAGNIVMHNAKHDMHEQRGIGLNIPWSKVIDTMACAYRLGESQGLKALAGRHCGMWMKSYMETVKPYSREYVNDWITNAVLELPAINEEYVTPKKQEVKFRSKKNPLFTPLSRIANSMAKNPDYDPWKAWAKVTTDLETEVQGEKVKGKKTLDVDKSKVLLEWKEWLEDEIGKMPTVGLDKVPVEVAKWYACRDSDANLRVYEVLDKMEREFGKQVKERDCQ